MAKDQRKAAIRIILIMGLVSLFGDVIYQGARSVNGPYLKVLGANAAIVGFVAGLGELLGYAIRLLSGYFADKTKGHWLFAFIGYGALLTVPLLALTGTWQMVAFLIVLERVGKAVRSPAKDTIVSQVSKQVGTGFAFGLQKAFDQLGATIGPVFFSLCFYFGASGNKGLSDYQKGYAFMWIPFVLVMACFIYAYIKVPDPSVFEEKTVQPAGREKITKVFWLYSAFTFVATAGFVNYILIAYHLKAKQIVSDAQIPLFYAAAMAIAGVVALVIGKIYDKLKLKYKNDKAGLYTLIFIPVLSCVIPVLGFSSDPVLTISAVLLWGVVMGIHETVMKSVIADLTPLKKRGTGYGIFNTNYGVALFLGSTLMGWLYGISIPLLISVVILLELISIPLFFMVKKEAEMGLEEK